MNPIIPSRPGSQDQYLHRRAHKRLCLLIRALLDPIVLPEVHYYWNLLTYLIAAHGKGKEIPSSQVEDLRSFAAIIARARR